MRTFRRRQVAYREGFAGSIARGGRDQLSRGTAEYLCVPKILLYTKSDQSDSTFGPTPRSNALDYCFLDVEMTLSSILDVAVPIQSSEMQAFREIKFGNRSEK
jgi:hypothetical protein